MFITAILDILTLPQLVFALIISLFAGFVKGATGFAMPMIILSGLGTFLAPEVALAGLIVPTLVTNLWQALRGGFAPAAQAAKNYRFYILTLLLVILFSAQLVTTLPQNTVFLVLGCTVVFLATFLLSGVAVRVPEGRRGIFDVTVGAISGLIGGISGIWGPLTVAYLTALDTPKTVHIKTTGVIFGLGALVLTFAHVRSGVLNAATLPLSMLLLGPALLGQTIGHAVQDRLDQQKFRRAILVVLLIAGANLIRRGIF